jgi:hypothetical protein
MRKATDTTLLGKTSDTRCHASSAKNITRKTCRNNCKYWIKGKCSIGY